MDDITIERICRVMSQCGYVSYRGYDEVELGALERAAQLRPSADHLLSPAKMLSMSATEMTRAMANRSAGRQPGAISHEWRKILGLVVQKHGGCATAEQMADLGEEAGLPTLSASLVRQRMTLYLSHGYVRLEHDGKYYVTDSAIGRFGLSRPARPEAIAAALADGGSHE